MGVNIEFDVEAAIVCCMSRDGKRGREKTLPVLTANVTRGSFGRKAVALAA